MLGEFGQIRESYHRLKSMHYFYGLSLKLSVICRLANQMYLMSGVYLLFSSVAVLEDADGIRLETTDTYNKILTFPKGTASLPCCKTDTRDSNNTDSCIFDLWRADADSLQIPVSSNQTTRSKYGTSFPKEFMNGLRDALICIDYTDNIGCAFIDGNLINDNFCNHNTWEIGLRTFAQRLEQNPLALSITPLHQSGNVNVESTIAARMENAEKYTAQLTNVTVKPVYEIIFSRSTYNRV